jgi:hypothetical protein
VLRDRDLGGLDAVQEELSFRAFGFALGGMPLLGPVSGHKKGRDSGGLDDHKSR